MTHENFARLKEKGKEPWKISAFYTLEYYGNFTVEVGAEKKLERDPFLSCSQKRPSDFTGFLYLQGLSTT